MARHSLDPAAIDRLVFGTVLQEPRTTNVAREAALAARIPKEVPATTMTAACISANVSIMAVAEAIAAGQVSLAIAGGVETLSDAPIRYKKAIRERMIASQKVKSPAGYVDLARGLKLTDLLPEIPAIAEFSTGLTMGENAERLAKKTALTREEQDEFALASHKKGAFAQKEGFLATDIVPAFVPPKFEPVREDNGIRADSTLEKLSELKPAFDRRFGTVTAGNSSFLTDGAAACLIASEEAIKAHKLSPIARIVSASLVAMDPAEELLLGPVFSVPKALDSAGLTVDDISVWEIHEAFSAPVLAAVKLLADSKYCRERLGRKSAVGKIPLKAVNAWGGSLSIGHPFGATGARLVTTCARRLQHEGSRYGVVTACAAGALGHAMVLERV
jgi:acetyl-CoA acyltransferase